MTKTARAATAIFAALTVTLAACGQGGTPAPNVAGPSGEPVQGGNLTWSYTVDATTVDPAACGSSTSWLACQSIYSSLMHYDPDTQTYSPGLAESLESEDGRFWTMTLRPNLRFTDGSPLDAAAVAFNWERIRDPQNRSSGMQTANSMTWTVVDPLTLRIELNEVNRQLPSAMYTTLGAIGSPKALQEKGLDYSSSPVGAGPFVLDSWSRGVEMKLSRNEQYWDNPRPYLDTLTIKTIPDEQQRLAGLQSGEIDVDVTTIADTVEDAKMAGLATQSQSPIIANVGMRYSTADPASGNANLRKALAHAMNTEQVTEALRPFETPVTTFALEGTPLYDSESTFPAENLDEARRYFTAYQQETGQRTATVDFIVVAGVQVPLQSAEMIKSQVERVEGLTFNIVPMEIGAWNTANVSGNYSIINDNLGAYFDPDTLYSRYHSNGADNSAKYSNPDVDEALTVTRTSEDREEINNAYKRVLSIIARDFVIQPLTYQPVTSVTRGDIGNLDTIYRYYPRPDLLWKQ